MFVRRLVFALLVLSCVHEALGADELVYGPPAAWVQAVATPKVGAMTEAPVRVIYQNRQLQFAQNTAASFIDSYIQAQTPEGLSAIGSLNLPWRSDLDVLTIHKVHLLRGDKVIDVLASGQAFTILRREDRLEYSMLDGVLTASLQPAGIEVGDILNIAFTLERTQTVLGSPDFSYSDLDLVRIDKLDMRATWEKPTAIRWFATPEVKGIKESRKGPRTEVTWSATDLGPITQPTNVPYRFQIRRRIDFSATRSWSELSKRVAPLFASASTLKPDSPLLKEAAAIRAAHATAETRAGAALRLVQDRVRYVFLGMNEGALVPTAADVTWSQKFGDCKAKTALLLALLRELSIEADPVMVNSVAGDGLDKVLPMGIVFDHVLVRARIDGREYWLDGTDKGDTRLEFLNTPNYYWGLPVRTAGNELVPMTPKPLREPQIDIRIHIDASKGVYANAPFSMESTLRGDFATGLRTELAKLPRAEQDRAMRDYWSRQYDFVTIKSVASSHDQVTGAFTMKMAGDAKLAWNDDFYMTDNLRLGYKLDLTRQDGPNKDAPFMVEHPVYTRSVEEIVLPAEGRNFSIYGTDVKESVGGAEYTRHSVIEKGVFRGEASMRSVAGDFPASQAAGVQQTMLEMSKNIIYLEVLDGYKLTTADLAAEYDGKLTSADAYVKRARTLSIKREYASALAAADSAVQMDARSDAALAQRGEVHYWMGNYDAALKDLNAALALNPKNTIALTGFGAVAIKQRDAKGALTYLDQSMAIDSTWAFTRGQRAHAYANLNRLDNALSEASEALKLSPDWFDMFELRVLVMWRKHAWDDARKELERMLETLPSDAQAQEFAASRYFMLRETDKALAAALRAVAIEPTAFRYVTLSYARPFKEFDARARDLDAALALTPGYALALAYRTALLVQTGNHAGAIEQITEQMKTASERDRKYFLITRGVQYVKVGKPALAEADFRAALGEPPDAEALNNLCWEMATTQVMLNRALAECERALVMKPGTAHILDSKGMALLQLGRYDDAIKTYDAVLAADASMPTSLFGRGFAKQRLCNCPAGNEDMDAARDLQPNVGFFFENYGLTLPQLPRTPK